MPRSPLLYGWSNSTLEAQAVGIDLAKKIGATIDDTSSSFCQGILMERILTGKIPTCTLDDVRNFADTSIFWGADPSNSHPRHLSRFSYYPRGEKRQKSYEEERTCVVVDVRKSPTATAMQQLLLPAWLPGETPSSWRRSWPSWMERFPRTGDKKTHDRAGQHPQEDGVWRDLSGPGYGLFPAG